MGFVPNRPLKITLYAGFTFLEYLFFSYFLFLNIKSKSFKKFVVLSAIIFSLFIVVYYLTVKFKSIDSVPIGIETILILICSFYYLYEETNDTTTLFIYNKPSFWIILGMVLYLAGSFFIYIFASNLHRDEIAKFWFVTNILSILKNILFCIAIYVHAKPSKESIQYNLELSRLN